MRLLPGFLTLLLAVGLVSCSSDDPDSNAETARTEESAEAQDTPEETSATEAEVVDGVQMVTVTVNDMGYSPKRIAFQAGMPARIVFDQHGTTACAWDVKSEELDVPLTEIPEGEKTAVEFTPDTPGEFDFTCGMNMLRGSIVVREAGDQNSEPSSL